ncbi:MAG: hypothetical protein O3A46_00920 [Candidatus Poribacteria bacterium]|nr:hypothetical protein [Candidatus Poribacteria bacterium]
MPADKNAVRERFEDAVATLVEKLKKDPWVLAAVLQGSLSYDEVWEQSDIDFLVIGKDESITCKSFHLTENDLNIHAVLMSRGYFRKQIESATRSSFFHSLISKSTLLYTTDETLREIFDNLQHVGAKDREVQAMRYATWALPSLAKAEKFLYVKRDPKYSYKWALGAIENLAAIEIVRAGKIVPREAIQLATTLNPAFFNEIYADAMDQPKTEDLVRKTLETISNYLLDQAMDLFKPLFEYLAEENAVRTSSDITGRFKEIADAGEVSMACEWLAFHEFIEMASKPIRLMKTSHSDVEEAAYYYDPMNPMLRIR